MRVLVTMLTLAGLLTGVSMATVFDVLLNTGRLLEELREGTATTNGTATTLIDTALSTAEGHADDEWNGGSLFLKNQDPTPDISNEVLGSVVAATSFSGSVDYPPVVPGSVTVTTPAGALTDDLLGVLTGPTASASDELSQRDATGTLPAPITAGLVELYTQNGVYLSGGLDGSLNGALGIVGTINYTTGVWEITNPAQDNPYFAKYYPDGGTGWLAAGLRFSGTLDHRLVVPGSLTVEYTDLAAAYVSRVASDDGSGHLMFGATQIGTINYTTGQWTCISSVALEVFDYQYYLALGSINLTTGAVSLQFDAAQTGSLTVDYSNTGGLFVQYIPVVMDFAVSTGTVTFSPAATIPTGAGDDYGLMHRRYPRWLLFQKLNEALAEIKQYVLDQTDILTSALVQNETALADSVRVFAVWNGNMTQTPRDWQPVTRYRHANGRLQFYDYLFGDTIRIQYYGDTTPVDDEQDTIPATIDPVWLAYETAVKCARWRLFQPGADKESQTLLVNDLMARRNAQKARANVINPNPTALKTAVIPER